MLIFNISDNNKLICQTDNSANILYQYFNYWEQYSIPDDDMNLYHCMIRSYNNIHYLIEKPIREVQIEDTINIYKYHGDTVKKYTFTIPENDWLYNYSVSKNILAVLGQYRIYIYSISNNRIKYDKSIELKKTYDNIKFNKNRLILWRCCYTCEKPGTYIAAYNINNGSLKFEKVLNNPAGYQLTFITPRRIIDYNNNKFIIADLIDYRFQILDSNLNVIKVISPKIAGWDVNPVMLTQLNKFEDFGKKNYNLLEKIDTAVSSIRLVDFLNDSTILICSTIPKSGTKFRYDIWKKQNNTWILENTYRNYLYNKQGKFDIYKYCRLFNSYQIDNGQLVIIRLMPFNTSEIIQEGITIDELRKRIKEFYINNNLKGSFYVFSNNK